MLVLAPEISFNTNVGLMHRGTKMFYFFSRKFLTELERPQLAISSPPRLKFQKHSGGNWSILPRE